MFDPFEKTLRFEFNRENVFWIFRKEYENRVTVICSHVLFLKRYLIESVTFESLEAFRNFGYETPENEIFIDYLIGSYH